MKIIKKNGLTAADQDGPISISTLPLSAVSADCHRLFIGGLPSFFTEFCRGGPGWTCFSLSDRVFIAFFFSQLRIQN